MAVKPAPKRKVAVKRSPYRSYASLLSTLGSGYKTPAQLAREANRFATTQYTAGAKSVQAQAESERRQAAARRASMQAAGQAAAQMGKSLIGDTGSAYGTAATELSQLARSLTGGVGGQNAADVAAANASLANVGAPAIAGSPGQQAVEEYLGATLPVRGLTESGTAQAFGTAGLINAMQLRATQEANAAFLTANKDVAEYKRKALAELAAGRPANAAQFLAQSQDAQRQQAALALGILSSMGEERQAAFGRGFSNRELNEKARQFNVSLGEEKRQFNSAQAQRANQFNQEMNRRKQEFQAGSKGTTGPQVAAEILGKFAENESEPAFQQSLARIFYTQPSAAKREIKPGSKDERKRVEALTSHLLASWWPLVRVATDPKNRAKQRANFRRQIRAWVNDAAIPTYNLWQQRELGGG